MRSKGVISDLTLVSLPLENDACGAIWMILRFDLKGHLFDFIKISFRWEMAQVKVISIHQLPVWQWDGVSALISRPNRIKLAYCAIQVK